MSGTLHTLLAAEAKPGTARDLFWSGQPRALARYVLGRSRGFAHRSASRLVTDALEVFALCQIAAPSLALAVGALAAFNAGTNAMNEGLLRAFRGAAREGRLFSRRFLVPAGVLLAVAPAAALIATRPLGADALFLIALRTAVAAVDAAVTGWTARTTLGRRPWISPWTSWTPVAVAALATALAVDAGGRAGVIGLAWTVTAARIGVQLVFLRAARARGPRRASDGRTVLPSARDGVRLLASLLPFVPVLALSAEAGAGGAERIAPLLALPFLFKLVARPAQATQLEVRFALARFGSEGAARSLRAIAQLTAGTALAAWVVAAAAGRLLGSSWAPAAWLAWAAALAAARALFSLATAFDGDLRWAGPSLAAHGAQLFLLPEHPAIAAGLELLLVIGCLRGFAVDRLARALAPAEMSAHAPRRFLEALDAGRLCALARVDLSSARRSFASMQALLERLHGALPAGTAVAAIDPVTVVVGWPHAMPPAPRTLQHTLLKAAPLDVVRIQPTTAEAVRLAAGGSEPDSAGRRWTWRPRDARWSSDVGTAEGGRVPWLLEAQRGGDRSIFLRGNPKIHDPLSGTVFVARRRAGRTVEVVEVTR